MIEGRSDALGAEECCEVRCEHKTRTTIFFKDPICPYPPHCDERWARLTVVRGFLKTHNPASRVCTNPNSTMTTRFASARTWSTPHWPAYHLSACRPIEFMWRELRGSASYRLR